MSRSHRLPVNIVLYPFPQESDIDNGKSCVSTDVGTVLSTSSCSVILLSDLEQSFLFLNARICLFVSHDHTNLYVRMVIKKNSCCFTT